MCSSSSSDAAGQTYYQRNRERILARAKEKRERMRDPELSVLDKSIRVLKKRRVASLTSYRDTDGSGFVHTVLGTVPSSVAVIATSRMLLRELKGGGGSGDTVSAHVSDTWGLVTVGNAVAVHLFTVDAREEYGREIENRCTGVPVEIEFEDENLF